MKSRKNPQYLAITAIVIVALLLTGQNILHFLFGLIGGGGRDQLLSLPVLILAGTFILFFVSKLHGDMIENRVYSELYHLRNLRGFLFFPSAMLFLLAISTLWSINPGYGLQKSIGFFVFCLGLSLLLLHQIRSLELFKLLLWMIFIFGIAQAIHGIVVGMTDGQHIRGLQLYALDADGVQAKVAMGIGLGRRAGMALLAGAALLLLTRSRIGKMWIILGLLVLVFTLTLSASRGALLSTLAGAAVFIPLVLHIRKIGHILLLLLVASTSYFLLEQATDLIEYRYSTHILERDIQYRFDMYEHALGVFLDNPLLGAGNGSWGTLYFGMGSNMYPHNIFAEVAAELGLAGLIVLFLFLVATARKANKVYRRAARSSDFNVVISWAIAVFIFSLVAAQTTGHIARNEWIWVAAALIFVLWNLQAAQSRHKP